MSDELEYEVALAKDWHNQGDPLLMFAGEAEGAIPNGQRVVKSHCEPGDSYPLGALGTVLSSLVVTEEAQQHLWKRSPNSPRMSYFYFVEWDLLPGVPVGVSDYKISHA